MIIKITPDKEKVSSMRELIENREKFVVSIRKTEFPTILAENYYEIIKELATAILLLDGFKAIGEKAHKELIESLSKYKEFEEGEIVLLDDLRIKRNKSSYGGKQIDQSYLENKEEKILNIIKKMKSLLDERQKI